MIKGSSKNWIWRYFNSLINFKRKDVSLALFLMVIIGLTEGISLLLLVPLLQLVGLDVQQGALSGISLYISSIFSYFGITPTLATVLVIYILVVGLNAYLSKLQNVKSAHVQFEYASNLRKQLFTAISHSDWLFFVSKRSSDLAHALTYEIERIASGTGQFLFIISSSIILLVYVIFAVQISGFVTGIIFLVGIVLLLLLRNKTQTASEIGEKLSVSSKDMYESAIRQMDGMKTIKSFNMEEINILSFDQTSNEVSNKYIDTISSYADVKFLFEVGSVVILGIIVFILLEVLSITTAELLILLFLFARMIPNFSGIQRYYQYFINMLPAFKTVTNLKDDFLNALGHESKGEIGFKDCIKLDDIEFAYKGRKDNFSIENLNLTIKSGEITALVGLSGAGKSTLVDILLGLIKPDIGQILIDEITLNDKNTSFWRDMIGYVAQDTFLFNDTIRNNLLVANTDADEDMLNESLRNASALEFVLKLPDGLDSIVGDRGVLLSGGESQRIALARALLREPAMLILDEATSNLDSDNEKRILDAIDKLHGEMTILMIAHRLSTIRKADKIYLIEDGAVVESGSWYSLLEIEGGKFKAFYQAQI